MSLINVFLSSSKVMIGVDTEGVDHSTGDFHEVSKFVHLPHANVIIAVRGSQGFLLILHSIISANAGSNNLDAIAKAMPAAFDIAYQTMVSSTPKETLVSHYEGQQVVLAGWSNESNRMVAMCFSRLGLNAPIEFTEIEEPGYIMPWNDNWGEAPEGSDRTAMIDLASAQTRNVKAESSATPMGGRLLVIELLRHALIFSSLCTLPMEERTAQPLTGLSSQARVFGSSAGLKN